MSPSAFFNHNRVIANFLTGVEVYLKTSLVGGYLAPETDVFLPDGGDVLRPDISFILEKNKGIVIGHIHGVPDLVCEVLSNATRDRDLGIKAERYLSNGVKEYWIIDPANKSIELWINRATHWEKKSGQNLASELLPGLQITAEDVFSGMPE